MRWIADPLASPPAVIAFRRVLSLPARTKVRLHVSADERYQLFIDGARIGCGPERGDPDNWFYESYDVELPVGEHNIVAITWALGKHAPHAQTTLRSAFVLAADGVTHQLLDTGTAEWHCKRVDGYGWVDFEKIMRNWYCAGDRVRIDGAKYPWGIERGEGDGWRPTEVVADMPKTWKLRPAMLPAMLEAPLTVGRVVHVDHEDAATPVLATKRVSAEAWDALLRGGKPLTVPANSRVRVIIDFGDYYCGYSEAQLSGGAGASVEILWAEALFEKPAGLEKGNRDRIYGKYFTGVGDAFIADGGKQRLFASLWWQAGRYLQVTVQTADAPLAIELLRIRETGYPCHFTASFDSSDPRLARLIPIALRTLAMCSHETYMDCPHYEQMMWVGDTRLQVLVTYLTSLDDRLPRKALELIDKSRLESGLTRCNYPTKGDGTIPGFSLWWVAMAHDFAFWRDDPEFVRALMPGVRAVIAGISATLGDNHLLSAPKGWNYQDWVPGWDWGVPADGKDGISGLLNFQFAWVLKQAAELEEFVGDAATAAHFRTLSADITAAAAKAFWDEGRGLFADDLAKQHFSEHTQCLALLSGQLQQEQKRRISAGLIADPKLYRTTIYYSHYLFEAYRDIDRIDQLLKRMPLWFDHFAHGLKTTVEQPEPTRSDCHAWGAHPVYHYFASILGIRPAKPGFREVRIEPRLADLTWAEGAIPHPRGTISLRVDRNGGNLRAVVTLPDSVSGVLAWGSSAKPLNPGKQIIEITAAGVAQGQ